MIHNYTFVKNRQICTEEILNIELNVRRSKENRTQGMRISNGITNKLSLRKTKRLINQGKALKTVVRKLFT